MKIEKGDNQTIIIIAHSDNSKSKSFWIVSFLLYVTVTLFYIILLFGIFEFVWKMLIIDLIVILVFLVYFRVSYIFINNALGYEKIIILKNNIIIENHSLFSVQSKDYEISQIKNFQYNYQTPNIDKHPLSGKSIDYLGFETTDKIIQNSNQLEKISFEYQENTICFGKNVYSWDFEETYDLIFQTNI